MDIYIEPLWYAWNISQLVVVYNIFSVLTHFVTSILLRIGNIAIKNT